MALVREISVKPKDHPRAHSPVACEGCVFRGDDGRTYVQLDTVGSATRQEKGKVSQSLQLDEVGARALMDLLRRAFPTLR